MDLPFPKALDQSVDVVEAVQDFLKATSPCHHYLPRNKYQEGHLRVLLPVYQTRKQLGHELHL